MEAGYVHTDRLLQWRCRGGENTYGTHQIDAVGNRDCPSEPVAEVRGPPGAHRRGYCRGCKNFARILVAHDRRMSRGSTIFGCA
jgi:hypothetical protein